MGSTGGNLRSETEKDVCAAKNWFRADENESPCKVCNKCKNEKKDECTLYPYGAACCPGQEGHHAVPVHCFMPPKERAAAKKAGRRPQLYEGCGQYDENLAPVICLDEDDHDEFHDIFNPLENKNRTVNPKTGKKTKAGKWSYTKARNAAADTAEKLVGCDKKCFKAQLDEYHQKQAGMQNPDLRADSGGRGGKPDIPLSKIAKPARQA